jgi:hypothetical protein
MPKFMTALGLPTKAYSAQPATEHPANRFIDFQRIPEGENNEFRP